MFHDILLQLGPPEHDHQCSLCDSHEEAMPVTATAISEDEVKAKIDAAVASALADVKAQLDEANTKLSEKDTSAAVTAAVAEAVTEKDTTIADLESKLEAEALARKSAEDNFSTTMAYLASQADAKAAEDRKEARITEVRALEVHPKDYLDDPALQDRYAAMTDEVWTSQMAEWQAIKDARPAVAPVVDGPLPEGRSALSDVADTDRLPQSPIRQAFEMFAGLAN